MLATGLLSETKFFNCPIYLQTGEKESWYQDRGTGASKFGIAQRSVGIWSTQVCLQMHYLLLHLTINLNRYISLLPAEIYLNNIKIRMQDAFFIFISECGFSF